MQQCPAHVKPGDHATVREAKVNESVNEYFQIIVKKKKKSPESLYVIL